MTKFDKTKPAVLHRYQERIEARLAELSTGEQAVAAHLMAHPHQLPFETANSLAKRLGVSGMTIGRTLKALGYQGLGDIRKEMRAEVSDAAPWGGRTTPRSPPSLKKQDRRQALRAELEAIEGVHALGETPTWQGAVKLIAAADQVFVTGFQSERGLAVTFADQLAYIRPRVRYIAAENRAFADIGTEGSAGSCLIMVDCRRYSRWFRLLGQRASALGVPLVMVTDAYCSWATKLTQYALQVRTDSGRFWDNNAPIASLLNLLIEDVIEQSGDAVHSQLDAASEFGSMFIGFERVHRQRRSKKDGRTAQPKMMRDSGRDGSGGTRLGHRTRDK